METVYQQYSYQNSYPGAYSDSYYNSQSNSLGWVILVMVLAFMIILLTAAWLFTAASANSSNNTPCECFGPWGVFPGTSADILNRCGDSSTDPCIFPVSSLVGAVDQCTQLKTFCTAFIYNEATQTMSIVDPTTSFLSPQVDLFVSQNGQVPG